MHTQGQDLDYLSARLHGRRGRLAEAGRLDELCRLASLRDLSSALYPEREFSSVSDLELQMVQDLLEEVSELAAQLAGGGARLMHWLLVRFQVENVKALLRGLVTHAPWALVARHLLALPKGLELKAQALATADSLAGFLALLPPGPLPESLAAGAALYGEAAKPFFLEAVLDRGYFQELVARVNRVRDEHSQDIQALVFQEIDGFHLRIVSRGKFLYGVAPALLLPLHVEGTAISRARLLAMLSETDLQAAAERALGRALDALPPAPTEPAEAGLVAEAARLEVLASERYLRLANTAFRRSPVGLGAVVGYVGIRRVEVANLITLAEGLQAGVPSERLRARLVPQRPPEAAYV